MKYLKKYENNIPEDTYILVKNVRTNYIGIITTNNYSSFNGILCKFIYPDDSATFKMYDTELYPNEYECENNILWHFLFKSKKLEEIKTNYEIYINSNKYNL